MAVTLGDGRLYYLINLSNDPIQRWTRLLSTAITCTPHRCIEIGAFAWAEPSAV